jgi:hypothetical protein
MAISEEFPAIAKVYPDLARRMQEYENRVNGPVAWSADGYYPVPDDEKYGGRWLGRLAHDHLSVMESVPARRTADGDALAPFRTGKNGTGWDAYFANVREAAR